jgi:hypothetical protein
MNQCDFDITLKFLHRKEDSKQAQFSVDVFQSRFQELKQWQSLVDHVFHLSKQWALEQGFQSDVFDFIPQVSVQYKKDGKSKALPPDNWPPIHAAASGDLKAYSFLGQADRTFSSDQVCSDRVQDTYSSCYYRAPEGQAPTSEAAQPSER